LLGLISGRRFAVLAVLKELNRELDGLVAHACPEDEAEEAPDASSD